MDSFIINNNYNSGRNKFYDLVSRRLPGLFERFFFQRWTHNRDIVSRTVNMPRFRELLEHRLYPLPGRVEIESFNKCNGDCGFCPVNHRLDPRSAKYLPTKIFVRVIDEIASWPYCRMLYLYSNNEPLLDERVYDFAARAREALPLATILLLTNGSLLTPDRLDRLAPSVDRLVVDNYNDHLVLNRPIQRIYDYMVEKRPEYRGKVFINLRLKNQKLTSRGGAAPNRRRVSSLSSPCWLPYTQFIVRADSMAGLCCVDAVASVSMGDLREKSILDIWRGEEYMMLRKRMLSGRRGIPTCEYCDEL